MSDAFGEDLRKREEWARALKPTPPPPQPLSPVSRRPASEQLMRTYVQWDDAFEEPTPTLFQLIRLIRGFNSTDLLEVFSKQGLLYQYRVGKGEPIQVPRGLFTQEVAERIIRKHNGRPSQFFSRATILFAQLLILRFGNPKSHRQTKEDIPTFSKILLACSSLAEGPLAAGVTAENIDASMGYLFGNFLLNKGHDLASKMGRHWAFLTKYSRALPQHNVADQIADALGERPELQAALVFGLLGRYIYDDETLAKLTTEPANFLTALTYFDGMPKEIAASGRTLIGTISGDQARHRECLRRGKHPRSAYDCRTIFDMPLLRVGEVLFPLDTSLLAEQYSSGQYARAYTALAPSRKHTRLADSWGKLFEHHIAELLKSSLPGALGKRLFIESEHGFYNVDFIIRDGESLVFLEATISGVPALRALSGDWSRIKESIDRILFPQLHGDAGKAFQMASAIERFRKGELVIPGIDPKTIKRIYPVLVLERGIPQIPLIVDALREEVRDKTKMLEANYFEFWDIDELELAAPLFKDRISDLIEEKHQSGFGAFPLNNFISRKPTRYRSDYVQELWRVSGDEVQELLFPGQRKNGSA